MKRRNFLQAIALAPFVVSFINSCKTRLKIKGKITGASSSIGHLLRDNSTTAATAEIIKKKTVIVGAGISGLSAARELTKNNINDFIVLELEDYPGGNSSFASNEISAYPQGAHYIPIANLHLTKYISFLQEHNVITSIDEKGLPVYNEMYICFDSQERLFLNGNWQEGVVPKRGLQSQEVKEIDRFFEMMNHFKTLKGSDGKYAFDIPAANSSIDAAIRDLDKMTMQQWLQKNNFKNTYLYWYVNYCSRDDFATTIDKISAWAAIHYYACRKGVAANADAGDVLTWPEGNGFLMNKLLDASRQNVRTNALVTSVTQKDIGLEISFLDTVSKKKILIQAEKCIMACPQYVTGRLLNDKARMDMVRKNFNYTPWLVANIKTTMPVDTHASVGLSWDNVIYNSKSLGYVNATHQLPQQVTGSKNLTYYLPLTDGDSKQERTRVSTLSHEQFCDLVMDDLKNVHPGIEDLVEEINVTLWGHSMVQPLPGFIFGDAIKSLSQSIDNNIHFAHSDISGISIFEEAFYQGINAAQKIISTS